MISWPECPLWQAYLSIYDNFMILWQNAENDHFWHPLARCLVLGQINRWSRKVGISRFWSKIGIFPAILWLSAKQLAGSKFMDFHGFWRKLSKMGPKSDHFLSFSVKTGPEISHFTLDFWQFCQKEMDFPSPLYLWGFGFYWKVTPHPMHLSRNLRKAHPCHQFLRPPCMGR